MKKREQRILASKAKAQYREMTSLDVELASMKNSLKEAYTLSRQLGGYGFFETHKEREARHKKYKENSQLILELKQKIEEKESLLKLVCGILPK